jgi:hypothetical protein
MLFKPTKVRGAFMSNYRQLTREQRYQIYALMKARVYQEKYGVTVACEDIGLNRLSVLLSSDAKGQLNHEFLPTRGPWLNDSSARI